MRLQDAVAQGAASEPGVIDFALTVHEASKIATGGDCQAVSISGTSAQSAAITASLVHITPTVDVFVREGADPTALATGVEDMKSLEVIW